MDKNISHYFDASLKTKSYDLTILDSGVQLPIPALSTTIVKSNYIFQYVISGQGTITVGNKQYSYSKGDFLCLRPNVVLQYHSDKKDPFSLYWIEFLSSSMEKILTNMGFSEENAVLHFDDKKILNQFKKIHISTKNNSLVGMLSSISALFSLMSYVISKNDAPPQKEKNNEDVYVEKAIWFIENNFSEQIDIEDIAKHVYLSRHYLTRIFTKKLQISPIQYLMRFRLNQAQNMLLSSKLSIRDVAINCGFNSPSNFAMQFKAFKGITPTECRKSTPPSRSLVASPRYCHAALYYAKNPARKRLSAQGFSVLT